MNGQPPALLPIRAAVHHFGGSKSDLYRWLTSEPIQGKKTGRSTSIVTTSVEEAIAHLPNYSERAGL